MSPGPQRAGDAGPTATPDRSAAQAAPSALSGPAPAAPAAAWLSNGRYHALVSASGAGGAWLDGEALTRFRPDPVEGRDGVHVYLELESGGCTSAAFEPVRRPATRESAWLEDGRYTIEREDDALGLATRFEISVDAGRPVEHRRLTLTNRTDRPLTVRVTTCVEVVLQSWAGDASHPAFSKLFVQTEALGEALLARRRPRDPEHAHPLLAHALVPLEGGWEPGCSFETDRAAFLGRAPGGEARRARPGSLHGGVGNVLDPVLCLSRRVTLPPGGGATCLLVLAAGDTREEAVSGLSALPGRAAPALAAAPQALASLPEAVRAFRPAPRQPRPDLPTRIASVEDGNPPQRRASAEPLREWNGRGGFSADGSEYVIRLPWMGPEQGHVLPPVPWTNCIATGQFGFLVSETGAGTTWSRNSREHRLTPWHNDPVLDPHGDALYLRDEETGEFWSPLAGPCPAPADYEVRHGFGVTRVLHESHRLSQDVRLFVPPADPVRIALVQVTNRAPHTRRLSLFGYQRLVLGVLPEESAPSILTGPGPWEGTLLATNPRAGDFADGTAFGAILPPAVPGATVFATADRADFLGAPGDVADPAALRTREVLEPRTGAGLDPCFATQAVFDLAPGATATCAVLLGEATSAAEAAALLLRYRDPEACENALAEATESWRRLVRRVHIETPEPALDLMVNGWLAYQTLSCRIQGRTAFFQSGGAFGFRDQLQDASAFTLTDPERMRAQILLHAAHQFVEGDVLHWWHPPRSRGIRTRFADDLVWLPYLTAQYVRATGDRAVLDEVRPFLTARLLTPGEDEVFLEPRPAPAGLAATVYEHAARALDRALTRGAHGLPLFGTGDWNDGMNRVGREGRGESVWMGFFLVATIDGFLPFAEARGEGDRVAHWRAWREDAVAALEDAGWDGAWYRRGYYDDGTPLGSASGDECRIDALVQAWATLAGATDPARAAQALDAMEQHLVSEREGLIRLLTPAFVDTPHDPGYIKAYVAGVRENGGQYTHAALWAVRALAEAGRRERAARLLTMLSPVSHTRTPAAVEHYRVEPYVIAADVYGEAPHVGRGGWTWYTGSAGWMLRVAVESVLGVTVEDGTHLVVAPCVPAAWPGFRMTLAPLGREARYEIVATRAAAGTETPAAIAAAASAVAAGGPVVAARLDGRSIPVEDGKVRLPLAADGATHRLEIELS